MTYFLSQLCSAAARREEAYRKKKKKTNEMGMGGGVWQGERAGSDEPQSKRKHVAFHQPAEKEVIHNSVDTMCL